MLGVFGCAGGLLKKELIDYLKQDRPKVPVAYLT